jgi:hypothetical protein
MNQTTPIAAKTTPKAQTRIVPNRFCQSLLLVIPHLASNYRRWEGELPATSGDRTPRNGDEIPYCGTPLNSIQKARLGEMDRFARASY